MESIAGGKRARWEMAVIWANVAILSYFHAPLAVFTREGGSGVAAIMPSIPEGRYFPSHKESMFKVSPRDNQTPKQIKKLRGNPKRSNVSTFDNSAVWVLDCANLCRAFCACDLCLCIAKSERRAESFEAWDALESPCELKARKVVLATVELKVKCVY